MGQRCLIRKQTGGTSLTLAVISCTTCYTIRYELEDPKIESRWGEIFHTRPAAMGLTQLPA
jgi:hypothetical protein